MPTQKRAAPPRRPSPRPSSPDGSLRPGLEGSFDASGYRLRLAPDGKPMFRPAVYIGGDFVVAGNVIGNRVAKWNSTTWSNLGEGASGYLDAIGCDFKVSAFFGIYRPTVVNSGGRAKPTAELVHYFNPTAHSALLSLPAASTARPAPKEKPLTESR